jgi:hypothetical protein
MPHTVHQDEGEIRDVPFMRNDMKNHATTMDKQLDAADAPGKADSELAEDNEART